MSIQYREKLKISYRFESGSISSLLSSCCTVAATRQF